MTGLVAQKWTVDAKHRSTLMPVIEPFSDRWLSAKPTGSSVPIRVCVEKLAPDGLYNTLRNANSRVEGDHGRLKARLRPMCGLKRVRTANVVTKGHRIIQNLRRGVRRPPHHHLTRLGEPALAQGPHAIQHPNIAT